MMDGRDYKNCKIAFNTLKKYYDIDFSKLESPEQHFFRLSSFSRSVDKTVQCTRNRQKETSRRFCETFLILNVALSAICSSNAKK